MPLTSLSSGNGGTIWTLLGMLFVAAIILVLAYFVTRWIASRGIGVPNAVKGVPGERFTVVAQLGVGRGERLLLVRIGDKCLLLGVTANSVTMLRELPDAEAAEWLKDTPKRPTFLEALQENLQKKK